MDSGALCRTLRPRGGAEGPPRGLCFQVQRLPPVVPPWQAGANLSATSSSSQNGSRTPAYLAARAGQAKALEALAEARAALQSLP